MQDLCSGDKPDATSNTDLITLTQLDIRRVGGHRSQRTSVFEVTCSHSTVEKVRRVSQYPDTNRPSKEDWMSVAFPFTDRLTTTRTSICHRSGRFPRIPKFFVHLMNDEIRKLIFRRKIHRTCTFHNSAQIFTLTFICSPLVPYQKMSRQSYVNSTLSPCGPTSPDHVRRARYISNLPTKKSSCCFSRQLNYLSQSLRVANLRRANLHQHTGSHQQRT